MPWWWDNLIAPKNLYSLFGSIAKFTKGIDWPGEDFRRVLPGWANEFYVADDHAHGALTATVRAYANADMNVLQAAQSLGVHPNTIYARFQRIFDISGLQARSFTALTELLIVSDCTRDGAAGLSESGNYSLPIGSSRPHHDEYFRHV